MQKNREQRIFIVEQYLLTRSRISVRRAFANQFRENIDVKTVDRVMEKWRRKGSILNQNKGNSGPKRSVRTDENITSVEARIQESSQSVRKIAAELGINREMLNMMFVNDIYPDQWFQQDGATAHRSLRAREWLTNQFGNKIISHHMEFPWPARSPDLSPLDYFLWGYVKENVFKRQPADIEILKEIVQEVVSSIDQDVLRAVMANFEKRINLCIEQQGEHFEHLL